MIHLLISLLVFLNYVESEIYDGKFYDPRNYTYADCILPGEPYIYLGNKATDKRGKQCEIWRTVTNYNLENLKGFNIYFFAEEYHENNWCRNIPLDSYQRDRKFNNASAHIYAQTNGWKHGPWCYGQVPDVNETDIFGMDPQGKSTTFKSKYAPMPCFEECDLRKLNPTTDPLEIPRKPLREYLYNGKLIENLSHALYSSFDHGDSDYYNSKPSTKAFSASFIETRKRLIYFGMPFFVFVIVCIFAKHYFSKWRANKKEREENQAEKKEEIAENNNENQNASQKPEGEIAVPPVKITVPQSKPMPSQPKKKLRKR